MLIRPVLTRTQAKALVDLGNEALARTKPKVAGGLFTAQDLEQGRRAIEKLVTALGFSPVRLRDERVGFRSKRRSGA